MLKPELIAKTFRLLTKNLKVPVTGKIRLGWENNENYLEVAHILEDNGASLIALHPRTKEQQYRGQARWEAITELRQAVSVPVVGNGDLMTPDDIDQMLTKTGCHAVMIGRGAIGNPWLFARIDKQNVGFAEISRVMNGHLLQMVTYHGQRGVVLFRKHIKRYLAGMPRLQPYSRQMVMSETVQDFQATLAKATALYGNLSVKALSG
jgi:tRNA-dihydrouridine synthase